MIKPAITNPAAINFQDGSDSPRKIADAPIPKTGTKSAAGTTVAAGCLDNNQAQATYPNKVFGHACQNTPNQDVSGAENKIEGI